MSNEAGKQAAVMQAIKLIQDDMVIGVGSGSTVNLFIDALQAIKSRIDGVVAASVESANRLKAMSIPVLDLNATPDLPFYFDGADEVNSYRQMIKGGGGALLREKIIATVATKFVCMVDKSKQVDLLGEFPVAVEVIPMARSLVAREIVLLGGDPVYREGFVTDNGNVILDVYNLKLLNPLEMEEKLKQMVGVVESGIFARRTADIVLVG